MQHRSLRLRNLHLTTETYYRGALAMAILALHYISPPAEAGNKSVVYTVVFVNLCFLIANAAMGDRSARWRQCQGWLVALDVAAVAWLAWGSGGADSVYVPLMYMVIGVSGVRTYRHSGLVVGLGALAAVWVVATFSPHHPAQGIIKTVTATDAVFFVAFGLMADVMADAFIYQQRRERNLLNHMVESLAAAVDSKDPYTYGHSRRVQKYALLIASELGLSRQELSALRFSALLHDIGKIHVPEEILHKPGRLTDKEWAVIKEHPAAGAYILSRAAELTEVAKAVAHHHERWDGGGYPAGLRGEDIPLLSHVILVADAFDAMTSGRAYHAGRTAAEALQELHRGSGSQFDPSVVRAVDALVRAGRWPLSDDQLTKAG